MNEQVQMVPGTLPRTTAQTMAPGTTGAVTMLGFGSLMSEQSAMLTTPSLTNFRYVRILGRRRVFGHVPPLFFEAGIARPETLELSSLSCEEHGEASCCGVAFDIPQHEWSALVEREDEYVLKLNPYVTVNADGTPGDEKGFGMLCTPATDVILQERGVWPRYAAALASIGRSDVPQVRPTSPFPAIELSHRHVPFVLVGAQTCWHWEKDSGLLPCTTYLRHCLLSSRKVDVPACVRASFLDDTVLVDRSTTLRAYLSRPGVEQHVMNALPPPGLETRYNG